MSSPTSFAHVYWQVPDVSQHGETLTSTVCVYAQWYWCTSTSCTPMLQSSIITPLTHSDSADRATISPWLRPPLERSDKTHKWHLTLRNFSMDDVPSPLIPLPLIRTSLSYMMTCEENLQKWTMLQCNLAHRYACFEIEVFHGSFTWASHGILYHHSRA